jgi:hypothetical protein
MSSGDRPKGPVRSEGMLRMNFDWSQATAGLHALIGHFAQRLP